MQWFGTLRLGRENWRRQRPGLPPCPGNVGKKCSEANPVCPGNSWPALWLGPFPCSKVKKGPHCKLEIAYLKLIHPVLAMLSHTCLNTYFHIGLMSAVLSGTCPRWETLVRMACQLPRAQEVWFWSGSWSLLSLGTSHWNGGELQLINLLSTGGLVLIQERGEISGPIRVLPISFSLKLSTMVFFIFQFWAIFASPTHLSLFLVSSPTSLLL